MKSLFIFLVACRSCVWRDLSFCMFHKAPYKNVFKNCTSHDVKFSNLKSKFTNLSQLNCP